MTTTVVIVCTLALVSAALWAHSGTGIAQAADTLRIEKEGFKMELTLLGDRQNLLAAKRPGSAGLASSLGVSCRPWAALRRPWREKNGRRPGPYAPSADAIGTIPA